MTKQARTLDDSRIKLAVAACRSERETLIVLLSLKAGLRAVEIAGLTWGNVEPDHLLLKRTKGDKPRNVPLAKDLQAALAAYRATRAGKDAAEAPVLVNTHLAAGEPLTANAVAAWLRDFYVRRMGWEGFSSHSGRRTFATRAARKMADAGGSIQDLRAMLGHSFVSTTMKYVDESEDAQRKVVDLI